MHYKSLMLRSRKRSDQDGRNNKIMFQIKLILNASKNNKVSRFFMICFIFIIYLLSFSVKINELIQAFPAEIYFFSIQLVLKIRVFELSNRFIFHRN